MKRIFGSILFLMVAVGLISWGRTGHSTIGLIAANHLTFEAKAGVSALLGNETLADVASWADDNRSPETAPWHFINVESGLSFEDFKQQVEGKTDVYTALVKEEGILADQAAGREDRVNALKYIVHFVGDIHQPMHVSRVEDKGGNTIQVRYDGSGTNLHSLWDTKLLEHAGLNADQLSKQFDKATPQQIAKWQSDPQISWAWESYQISTQLYAEIDKNGVNIDDSYYNSHILIVESRIEKAGIRLAGVLNMLFKNVKPSEYPGNNAQQVHDIAQGATIIIEDAPKHIGETVKICSKVYGHKDFGSMALVNMGDKYPNQLLTLVLRGDTKNMADSLEEKSVCVTGKLINYNGKPEIIVTDASQVTVQGN